MALKSKKTVLATNKGDDITKLSERLIEVNKQILSLQEEEVELRTKIANIHLRPLEIGGYCMSEISSGRSKKLQKCLIECESGTVYVRPVKDNGELSGRHFSIIPILDQTYADFLKPVEE